MQYDLDICVEIFGIKDVSSDYSANVATLARKMNLNEEDVVDVAVKGNGLVVKLRYPRLVNEWERKSREARLKVYDVFPETNNDAKIKIFAAAPTKYKLLLHKVRNQLPDYKYIWIGKRGVMARREARSNIVLLKSENDLDAMKDTTNQ
ncbi:FP25K [Betabaculovirus altermyunipunctae]|uniref:FP25K n=1 Tax=Betabaculovirus altermyunipunctae TaxID=3051996 RepID=A0A1S5YE15_9BBAC|nr:FP25K [Betabaculovirus altermyunipunctae]AQQ80391.1 FP25K [Betabaculovirus altermyunipunctae]